MKKILLFSLMLMIIGNVSVQARRLDKPNSVTGMAIIKCGSTVKVLYQGAKRSKVTVTIYNDKNEAVYIDYIGKAESFVRPYNFSALPEGSYTISLEDESGKQVQNVSYRSKKIEVLANVSKVSGEEGKVLLTLSNKTKGEIGVRIFNQAGEALYASTEQVDGDFAKVYNLQKVSGTFTFEITDTHGAVKTIRY